MLTVRRSRRAPGHHRTGFPDALCERHVGARTPGCRETDSRAPQAPPNPCTPPPGPGCCRGTQDLRRKFGAGDGWRGPRTHVTPGAHLGLVSARGPGLHPSRVTYLHPRHPPGQMELRPPAHLAGSLVSPVTRRALFPTGPRPPPPQATDGQTPHTSHVLHPRITRSIMSTYHGPGTCSRIGSSVGANRCLPLHTWGT